ncbi:MAG TPA: hypothetical protein VGO30_00060, partial [Mycobacterium sp.]|nr:hypothetical protein [Mycobacterium sp.]
MAIFIRPSADDIRPTDPTADEPVTTAPAATPQSATVDTPPQTPPAAAPTPSAKRTNPRRRARSRTVQDQTTE